MTTRKLLTNFNASPYYDDFDINKNFLKVLFKPSTALQVRELNQLQSVLNEQTSRFANHIFKDGSSVFDGNFTVDTGVSYIKLHDFERHIPDTTGVNVNTYLTNLEGRTLISQNGNVVFKVRKVEVSNTSEPNTIVGVYLSGSDRALKGDVLTTKSESGLQTYTVTCAIPDVTENVSSEIITGDSSIASVNDGIFYISGYFHKVEKQTIILDKYSNIPSYRIGLEVKESIVSSNDDSSLYDNAQGSPNFSAPGADRFSISLVLKKIPLLDSDGSLIQNSSTFDFYEFIRVKLGQKTDHIQNSQYSYLGEELARRTYDTNGDFVVKNFVLDIDEYSQEEVDAAASLSTPVDLTEKLKLTLDPGKAYIRGYEVETITPIKLQMDKGRDFNSKVADNKQTFSGNNIKIDFSGIAFSDQFISQLENSPLLDIFDENNFSLTLDKNQDDDNNEIDFLDSDFVVGETVTITKTDLTTTFNRVILDWDSSTGILSLENKTGLDLANVLSVTNTATVDFSVDSHSDNKIGTCRMKQLFHDGSSGYKISLFDIKIGFRYSTNDMYGFKYSHPTEPQDYVFYVSSGATLENAEASQLIFGLGKSAIKSVTKVDFSHNKSVSPSFKEFDSGTTNPILEIQLDLSKEEFPSNLQQTSWGIFYPNNQNLLKKNLILFNKQTGQTYENFDFRRNEIFSNIGYIKIYRDSNDNFDFQNNAGEISIFIKVEVDKGDVKGKILENNAATPFIPIAQDMKTSGKIISLRQADVLSVIVNGLDSDGNKTEITSSYIFDNGQRDAFYDFATIKLKDGVDVSSYDSFEVEFTYFDHTSGHFFVRDSYPSNISYESIPVYSSKNTGKSYSLTDVVDFRPTRKIVDTVDSIYDSYLPFGEGSGGMEVDFEYYLPRVDKVVLSKDRQFKIIRGSSSEKPKTPQDDTESMTLYIITVSAFTYNDNDVSVVPVHNRRYTMKDIGILDKKIQELQSVSNLRTLKEKSKNVQIRDSQGNDIFKNGVLLDDFSGHAIGDTTSDEYRCSIDFDTGELRPSFYSDFQEMVFDDTSENVVKKGPLLMLEHTPTVLINQEFETGVDDVVNVNSVEQLQYFGEMVINPASDIWFNQSLDPRVNVNNIGENDAWQDLETPVLPDLGKGFGTQWNDWEKIWTGKEIVTSKSEEDSFEISTNNIIEKRNRQVSNSLFETESISSLFGVPNRIESDVFNKKIDNSVIPKIRSKVIDFVCINLEPNTQHFAFFDDLDVNSYVTPCAKVKVASSDPNVDAMSLFTSGVYDGSSIRTSDGNSGKVIHKGMDYVGGEYIPHLWVKMDGQDTFSVGELVSGNPGITIAGFESPSNQIKSDYSGIFCGSFNIPSQQPSGIPDTSVKFRTGQRLLRIIDNDENKLEENSSLSESVYAAQGFIQDPEDYVHSTRLTTKRRTSASDELSISRDVFSRSVNSINRFFNWKDPLTQTFTVDHAEYRNGVFLHSVELYFDGAEREEQFPISIEIRPTVNGYPSTSIVIPFSEVTLTPNEIVYTEGESTRFTFEVPVYLKPAEYALVIKSNGKNYNLKCAVIGKNDSFSNKVSKPIGLLYTTANSGDWKPLNNKMLKLKINRCDFVTNVPSSFKLKLGLDPSTNSYPNEDFNLFKFNVSMLKNDIDLNFKYKIGNDAIFTDFSENRNEELDITRSISSQSDFQVHSEFLNSSSLTSPVIDMDRVGLITVKNLINNFNPDSDLLEPDVVYVSGMCNLISPYESKDLRVYLDLYKKLNTNVYVYYKVLNTNDSDNIDDVPWFLMKQITPQYVHSTYENEYLEFVFGTDGGVVPVVSGYEDGKTIQNFNVYSIKIVLSSNNPSLIPKVRNLRAIALQEPAAV